MHKSLTLGSKRSDHHDCPRVSLSQREKEQAVHARPTTCHAGEDTADLGGRRKWDDTGEPLNLALRPAASCPFIAILGKQGSQQPCCRLQNRAVHRSSMRMGMGWLCQWGGTLWQPAAKVLEWRCMAASSGGHQLGLGSVLACRHLSRSRVSLGSSIHSHSLVYSSLPGLLPAPCASSPSPSSSSPALERETEQ